MFEIIFAAGLSLYFIHLVIFMIGAGKKFAKLDERDLPAVSVIVAARNEEDNILSCLESLDKLIYPEGKLEIIIVDDHSTDSTGRIIESFIEGRNKFRSIVPHESIAKLRGKTNALANAVRIAQGVLIATTDADCTVPPDWVRTIASYFIDDVAFVGGFTTQYDFGLFSGMQAIDFIYLLTVASGTINLGKPLSCIGNNMAYRKSVYLEIGGYEGLPFSVTEDFRLLMAIHNLKKYKIIYPLDKEALVVSKPCPDWKTLFWQKKRWGVGGKESDLTGYLVMIWGYISNAAILITPFLYSTVALYLCMFKFCTDYFFILPVYNRLKLKLKFSHFLAFELYFIIYVIVLPLIVLPNRTVRWKGRTF
jgi:cellulose synthase/poly-beta-1,6-N-acetylglucosamine synthase-like glycosyltransferase